MLLFLFTCLVACQRVEYPAPIEGTMYRITEDLPARGSEVRVDLLTNWKECAIAKVQSEDMKACVPFADRSSGEVHLSFILRDPGTQTEILRSLEKESLRVTHNKSTQTDFALIPHDPKMGGQLFVLLIDGSGSMYENDGVRIKKVRDALLDETVISGFFPQKAARTGVVLLRFSSEVKGLDGGPPRVLRNPNQYRKMVQEHILNSSGGYTHMYDAVKYGVKEVGQNSNVQQFMLESGAQPTLVVLTDGFNNEAANDTCSSNVPRLQKTLDEIRTVRKAMGASIRPTVYTVGLGRPLHDEAMSKRRTQNSKVSSANLCGQYAERRIDGGLEDYGIDNISLEWIAEAGGGLAFVKRESRGLASVFAKAAAPRHRWFEVKYRTPDNAHHRRSFDVEVQLLTNDQAFSTVSFHPSGWMDAPGGVRPTDKLWVEPRPFRFTMALLMPTLGLLVLLNFLGPAWFNARRAFFRRARRRAPKKNPPS